MPHMRTSPWRGVAAVLTTITLILGLSLTATASARGDEKAPSTQTYLQTLVAYEKLSYDVFTALAVQHPRGPFRLMARAEQRDLIRMRQLLRAASWRDLTRGDGPGQFRHFPLLEHTYWDMTGNGQSSIAEGARVGIALQQLSLAVIYELLASRPTAAQHTQLRYSQSYAINRISTLQATIRRAG